MTNEEFDALAARVIKGTASTQEAEAFVKHASYLRAFAIVAINNSDTWDHEHPEVSYRPHDPGSESYGDELLAWAEEQGVKTRW